MYLGKTLESEKIQLNSANDKFCYIIFEGGALLQSHLRF